MSADLEILKLSAVELLRAYRARSLSPVEVVQAILRRIAEVDPAVNAFCLVDGEAALEAARKSEARWHQGTPIGRIDGVPTTIKDLVLTKGWPTLRGSLTIKRDQPWDEDAPSTASLRDEGAILLGKTTTPEFGWKGVTDSPLTGITRNPWNTALTPGGSSGGAAVAAALGLGALHIGTDGGGSIRIPAGLTGVFGLKPSFGRVPAYPASPMGTLSHVGPITRTVEDAALMLSVLTRYDARDWTALPPEPDDYLSGLDRGVAGLRIAFSADLGYVPVEPEIAGLVEQAATVFSDLGAEVERVDPGFDEPGPAFATLWFAGAAHMARVLSPEQRSLLDPGLQEIIAQGEAMDLRTYMAAVDHRTQLGVRMKKFHQVYDLLILPSLPLAAFTAGQEVPEPGPNRRWVECARFTYPFNMTQQPACSMPCGFTKAGLPAGLQIVGPQYGDRLVLRAAYAFESLRPIVLPDAPRAPDGESLADGLGQGPGTAP